LEVSQPVVLGRVVAPYGIKGWLKIRPYSADPLALLKQPEWLLKPADGSAWHKYRPLEGRMQGAMLVASVSGIETRDAAAALKDFEIAVPRESLPPTKAGEYYWSDLVGLAVVNRDGETLGRVLGVMDNGAHPILRFGEAGEVREHLIPFVPAYVDRVSVEAGRIDVDWRKDY
jgi:16S rRNA processing protein RimM